MRHFKFISTVGLIAMLMTVMMLPGCKKEEISISTIKMAIETARPAMPVVVKSPATIDHHQLVEDLIVRNICSVNLVIRYFWQLS